MPYQFKYGSPSADALLSFETGKARRQYDDERIAEEQKRYELDRELEREQAQAARRADMQKFFAGLEQEQRLREMDSIDQRDKLAMDRQTALDKQRLVNKGFENTTELRELYSRKPPEIDPQVLEGLRKGVLGYTDEQQRQLRSIGQARQNAAVSPRMNAKERAVAMNKLDALESQIRNNPGEYNPEMENGPEEFKQKFMNDIVNLPGGIIGYRDENGVPNFFTGSQSNALDINEIAKSVSDDVNKALALMENVSPEKQHQMYEEAFRKRMELLQRYGAQAKKGFEDTVATEEQQQLEQQRQMGMVMQDIAQQDPSQRPPYNPQANQPPLTQQPSATPTPTPTPTPQPQAQLPKQLSEMVNKMPPQVQQIIQENYNPQTGESRFEANGTTYVITKNGKIFKEK